MRNLFPVIPHYWIKDEVLYCLRRSWLGAVRSGWRSFRVHCL